MRPKRVILLVDDNERTLSTRRFLLETRGYRVLSASSPHEALEIAEAALPRSIDLLLTDFVMPQMDGNQLALRFLQVQPNAATMIVSGLVAVPPTCNAHVFLPKGAATPAEMLERIRVLLAHRRSAKKLPGLAVYEVTDRRTA
jgi:CheY-like chemotaxis protein